MKQVVYKTDAQQFLGWIISVHSVRTLLEEG